MIISTTEQPLEIQTVKKTRTRVNRSKAQWKKLVDEYDVSEITQAEFCRQHKIACSSFLKWRKRFSTQSANDFVNITEPLEKAPSLNTPENQATVPWQVELEIGVGIILRIRAS